MSENIETYIGATHVKVESVLDRIDAILEKQGMCQSDPLPINELREDMEKICEDLKTENGRGAFD